MYSGDYYAQKFKNTIDTIGETVTVEYKKRTGYDPLTGEKYETIKIENFKMLVRKTDKTDYEQLPEGLNDRDVRKIYFYQDIPYKDVTITRHTNNQEYKIIAPIVDNPLNGANIYYYTFIALKEVQ